jgi:hypothetical protein
MDKAAENHDRTRDSGVVSRRGFLHSSALMLGAAAASGPLQALLARSRRGLALADERYGSLRPVEDQTTGLPLLMLPAGFRYLSYGWTGDRMSDGTITPRLHDGMAVTTSSYGHVTLTRNHEISGNGKSFGPDQITYDPKAPGGTSNLIFNTEAGRFEKSWTSLSGTIKNCAGGPTPWKTWLTCEETVLAPGDMIGSAANQTPLECTQDHGWIFEVPALGDADPVPLQEMGRFVHEAIAVDPETGIVYETHDCPTAGFYRFIPNEQGVLRKGGRLQMLRAVGRDDLSRKVRGKGPFKVEWVDIKDPTRAHSPGGKDGLGVYMQGKDQGASTFARLEGCWCGPKEIYFVSTSGGDASLGQIWALDPKTQRLRLVFESPSADVLNMPDNITVSPRGDLILCEDGTWPKQRLHGLTTDGRIYVFAENNIDLRGERNGIRGEFYDSEWAGATFSPDGEWLFVNIQTPGITFAITGPWSKTTA